MLVQNKLCAMSRGKGFKSFVTYFGSSFLLTVQEVRSPGPAELPDVVHVYLYQIQYMALNIKEITYIQKKKKIKS